MAFPLPDPETADRHGLVFVGGDLDPDTVIAAYRKGLFPWRGGTAIPWYSPDPRGVARVGAIRASHKLRQRARSRGWIVAFDRDFAGTVARCATTPRAYEADTWITPDIVAAYAELHRRGVGHAVEVYADDRPIGGLYGLTFGRFFHGESMYFVDSGASKLALWALSECLAARGFELIDCRC
jgi:leucyl/phenylalanyl-tRNA--protein transferase